MSEIQHDVGQQRFTLSSAAGEAVLEYHVFKDEKSRQCVDFTRTWVPPLARGQGLAERLVREGLRWAKTEALVIHASCWYVAKFLRH
jgi:predicted GNAT family acetyltransferase